MADEFIDLELNTAAGYHDISFESGDFKKTKGFDTAIFTSLLTDARANSTQVSNPIKRRGWIGNLNNAIEIGSLNWLYEQARLINATVSGLVDQSTDALQWFINFNYATGVQITPIRSPQKLELDVKLLRPTDDNPDAFRVTIWQNTEATNV